ncbi:hypothetical protein skT53_29390 [Effusibacillus dendaii]|uniref:LysR substrate-binding domain-containing protein n=1 Tax=Effusibacillus dendaii TaxID=2743772 RepID=A0A7I8DCX9_9BACL|nr:hypothetical protein skT53_29390 [Effusibacillus dendaii]
MHDRIINACVQLGYTPKVACKSSQWDFIGEMVAADLGIALLPEIICKKLSDKEVVIIPLLDSIPWNLCMIWPKNQYVSFTTKEFIKVTRSLLEQPISS